MASWQKPLSISMDFCQLALCSGLSRKESGQFTMNKLENENEIKRIESYPDEQYIKIIHEVGFECDCCGKCCTSEFNDHVFLLDDDTRRIIQFQGKSFLRPAPYFELCDNYGRFYVMGYALKTKPDGDCIFYSGGKCIHYNIRPLICRIFPYMLHREPDEDGNIEFRQISGIDMHGTYHNDLKAEQCTEIIKTVKEYEINFLRQQLNFIKEVEKYCKANNLKRSDRMYDIMMRRFKKGETVEVNVFFNGEFTRNNIQTNY